jgi:hypothetical protein
MRTQLTQSKTIDRPAPVYAIALVSLEVIAAITRRLEDRTSALELNRASTFVPDGRAQRAD